MSDESNSNQTVHEPTAETPSQVLDSGDWPGGDWSEQDLPAMFRHQLSAPLRLDLGPSLRKIAGSKTRRSNVVNPAAPRLESFADLLFASEPPLDLLKLSKDFFKDRTRQYAKGSPEWQFAYLFYLLSVSAAGSRASEISSLARCELLAGIKWALQRDWLDQRAIALLSHSQKMIHHTDGSP
jgi:hypothetical protein